MRVHFGRLSIDDRPLSGLYTSAEKRRYAAALISAADAGIAIDRNGVRAATAAEIEEARRDAAELIQRADKIDAEFAPFNARCAERAKEHAAKMAHIDAKIDAGLTSGTARGCGRWWMAHMEMLHRHSCRGAWDGHGRYPSFPAV